MTEALLGNIMIDCTDAQALRDFYHGVLGWQKDTLFHRPAVRSASGVVLLFNEIDGFERPTWPEQTGAQQKQMHLDFQVADVDAAVQRAISLGAYATDVQYGDNFVTMVDLDGHVFCLCAT